VVEKITPASYNACLVTAGPGVITKWIDRVINVIGLPLIIQRGLSSEGPATGVDIGLLVEYSEGISLPLLNLDSAVAGGN
jgi:hypothetical protein